MEFNPVKARAATPTDEPPTTTGWATFKKHRMSRGGLESDFSGPLPKQLAFRGAKTSARTKPIGKAKTDPIKYWTGTHERDSPFEQ